MSGGKGDDPGLADKGDDPRGVKDKGDDPGLADKGDDPRGVALVTACLQGQVGGVQSLLMTRPSPLDCRADVTDDDAHWEGVTPLWAAAGHGGRLELVKYLVQKGASVNLTTHSQSSPLRAASYAGHLPVVEFLVESGAEVNSANSDGSSVLMVACEKGHRNIVRVLLNHEADVDHSDNDRKTALMLACDNKHTDIVQALLDHDADADLTDNEGQTALIIACGRRYTDIVHVILDHWPAADRTDSHGKSALMFACDSGHLDVVKALLDHEDNINYIGYSDDDDAGQSALTIACAKGHTDIVQTLLDHGAVLADPNSDGKTRLMFACDAGHLDIVTALLDHDDDIDYADNDDQSALMIACAKGHTGIVQALLDHGAKINPTNSDGKSALMFAYHGGHYGIVQVLLDGGADVNSTNSDGKSVLIFACYGGHYGIVQVLLDGGADVNTTSSDGKSALMFACGRGHPDVVKALLDQGADVTSTDSNADTALRMVCKRGGHKEIVQVLLAHGAEVNSTNSDGQSVLLLACDSEDIDTDAVRALLDHGADVDYVAPATDDMEWSGNTALHTAAARGRVELCKLLLACGATVTTRNGRGETPLLTAAIEGQEELVDFLADLQYSSRNAKADALELLGAICWVEDRDADRCLSLWQRAMEERHRPGKPTVCKQHAQKIAVYGHATEVQTPAELRSLQQQSRDDQRALGVQCALISERVLDKGHHTTARAINYVAADLDDDNDTKRTVELLLHSVDNHSGLCPFDSGVAAVYILLVCVLEDDQTAAVENEEAEGDERHRSTFGQILAALKRATSDFRRGEARREQEREKTTGDRALVPNTYYLMVRENLLKVVLHLCCLLGGAEHRATPAQRAEFSALIGDFVRKDAPRGKSGNTLLHMACDEETHVFDFEDIEVLNPGVCDGCPFPAAEAVRVLLDAGADVTAQNEAGHTALKTMHQQKDQRSYENLRIYALMKAARWALHMSKKETPAVSSTS